MTCSLKHFFYQLPAAHPAAVFAKDAQCCASLFAILDRAVPVTRLHGLNFRRLPVRVVEFEKGLTGLYRLFELLRSLIALRKAGNTFLNRAYFSAEILKLTLHVSKLVFDTIA